MNEPPSHPPNKQWELRQRRTRIIQDNAQQKQDEKRVKHHMKQSTSQSSTYFIQIFVVVFTALVIVISAVLQYANPRFFQRLFGRQTAPPFYFATKYPNSVVLERDLPRFFQTLSIATPANTEAQQVVQKVIRSRTNIKRRLASTKAIVKAWDADNIQVLVNRGLCGGDDFAQTYKQGSNLRKDDLVMWCLVATRVVEGYFLETVEMMDSALFLTQQRGIVVQKKSSSIHERDGQGGALSMSFYLHPRHNNTLLEWIPSKVLAMAMSTPEDALASPLEAREILERYLYDLIITQGNEDNYLMLEEICQPEPPDRAIGMDCPHGNSGVCCFIVVPEKYGGRFHLHQDEN